MHNLEIKEHIVKSSYHSLPVKINIYSSSRKSDTVLVLHHGAFETAWGDANRYRHILLWLQKNIKGMPHVVWYETARQEVSQEDFATRIDYWKALFKGKKFSHELDDVRKVYAYINSRTFTRVTGTPVKNIYALGFSLGGTLAMLISAEQKKLVKLCIVGSALSTKRKNLPVLQGYPSKRSIIEKVRHYKNYFKIIQGFSEEVVPFSDAEEIFHSLQEVKLVTFTRYKGANHMFSGNNKYGLFRGEAFLKEIRDFFAAA